MPRHYTNPPVVEALAEVYFVEANWDMAIPGLFYERIRDRFPKRRQVGQVSVNVEIGPQGIDPKLAQSSMARVQFLTDDESQIVQVGQDVLVVNQLRPYPRFPDWSPLVAEMLAIYREVARPTGFSRVGVRYINKVVLPGDVFELSDYFKLYPEVPDELGSPYGPFVMRVESHPPLHMDHALSTTFGSSETDDGKPALLLDFYDTLALPSPGNLDLVPQFVSDAHDNIEAAFEHTIGDKARELFQEVADGRAS